MDSIPNIPEFEELRFLWKVESKKKVDSGSTFKTFVVSLPRVKNKAKIIQLC